MDEDEKKELGEKFEKITEAHNFILDYFTEQKLDIYSVIFVLDTTKHELIEQQLKRITDKNG
jgi:hypothetical protein